MNFSVYSLPKLSKNVTIFQGLRSFMYALLPSESSFGEVSDVPDYLNDVIPLFLGAMFLEYILAFIMGFPRLRLNDAFSSLGAGSFMQLTKCIFLSVEMVAYTYIYNHWRLVTLPWDSAWTWYLCFLGVDFAYYWLHRAAHEVNIIWAAHQVHHSSEDYNLSTALRQSVLQHYTSWMFYLPMALGIPPSIFLVHAQFTMLYQFWIHTEVVRSLGPLEYILNTASHHRVHHGRNPYCIDKNYGGTLIIWDRMFGTFQAETSEQLAYGLVHPLASWNPLWTQFCHYHYIWKTFWDSEGLRNKLSVLFKGPGWTPGQPRLGNTDDLPKIEYPIVKYDSSSPLWCNVYAVCHTILFQLAYIQLVSKHMVLSPLNVWAVVLFLIFTMTSIGAQFDCKWYAPYMEFTRCLLFLLVDLVLSSQNLENGVLPEVFLSVVRAVFVGSTFLWMIICMIPKDKTKTQ